MTEALLEMRQVSKSYPDPGGRPRPAVDRVSFRILPGEALGLAGPSGSGKSTIARIALGLEAPDAGDVLFLGRSILGLSPGPRRDHFRSVQMVWQDPVAYLNPYQAVLATVVEPMASFRVVPRSRRSARALELLEQLGLPASIAGRKPARLSAGQCQRIAIARAIAAAPRLLICDEALVNLDLPQQVSIIRLLHRMRRDLGLGILFVSHDRDSVRALCSRTVTLPPPDIVKREAAGVANMQPIEKR